MEYLLKVCRKKAILTQLTKIDKKQHHSNRSLKNDSLLVLVTYPFKIKKRRNDKIN